MGIFPRDSPRISPGFLCHVSEISLRAYFHEHKGATMKVDGQGKSVVHALASNKYVSKIGQLVLWFVRSHESHTELVGVLDAALRS